MEIKDQAYFTTDFLDFFADLRKNNNRAWFSESKDRYLRHVKEPFDVFLADMIEALRPLMPDLLITPKEAKFRIYRDVRFSKDKTPYQNHVSAVLSPGGRKNMEIPGVYIQLSDAAMYIYSGLYKPQKELLYEVRLRIAENPKHFREIYSAPKFVEYFGHVEGEKNKRIASEFEEAVLIEPLILNKGWYARAIFPPEAILRTDLKELVFDHARVAQPFNQFLKLTE